MSIERPFGDGEHRRLSVEHVALTTVGDLPGKVVNPFRMPVGDVENVGESGDGPDGKNLLVGSVAELVTAVVSCVGV